MSDGCRSTVVLGALAILLVGCGRPYTYSIPQGAQVVHVVSTASEVRLEPASVHGGDVWMVIDAEAASYTFVGASRPGGREGDPLTDDDLARLARGDTQYTATSGFSAGGCSPEQAAEDRGKMGPCGNVMKFTVRAGKYAVLWGDTAHPLPMAVLEVLP